MSILTASEACLHAVQRLKGTLAKAVDKINSDITSIGRHAEGHGSTVSRTDEKLADPIRRSFDRRFPEDTIPTPHLATDGDVQAMSTSHKSLLLMGQKLEAEDQLAGVAKKGKHTKIRRDAERQAADAELRLNEMGLGERLPQPDPVWRGRAHPGSALQEGTPRHDEKLLASRSESVGTGGGKGKRIAVAVAVGTAAVILADNSSGPVPGPGSSGFDPASNPNDPGTSSLDPASGGFGSGLEARIYTVKRGDTLWAIAERFYGNDNRYRDIAAASGIDDPGAVDVGQVLTIP